MLDRAVTASEGPGTVLISSTRVSRGSLELIHTMTASAKVTTQSIGTISLSVERTACCFGFPGQLWALPVVLIHPPQAEQRTAMITQLWLRMLARVVEGIKDVKSVCDNGLEDFEFCQNLQSK